MNILSSILLQVAIGLDPPPQDAVVLSLDKILAFDDALAAQLGPYEVGKNTPFFVRMNEKTKLEWWLGRRSDLKNTFTNLPGQHIFVFEIDNTIGDRLITIYPVGSK